MPDPIDYTARFWKVTLYLTKQCNKEIDEEDNRIWELLAGKYGWQVMSIAMEQIAVTRKGNAPFPTPAELSELCMEITSPLADKPEEIAAKIMGAISKFGYSNPKEAEKYIGPAGWRAVKLRGGWSDLCMNTTKDQVPFLISQFRDLVRVGVEREQREAVLDRLGGRTLELPQTNFSPDSSSAIQPSREAASPIRPDVFEREE